MDVVLTLAYFIFTLVVLYHGLSALVWELGTLAYFLTVLLIGKMAWFPFLILVSLAAAIVLILRFEPLRASLTTFLFAYAKKSLPKLSKTEEEALQAGDTWMEEDIFRGRMNWDKMAQGHSRLNEEEQAFLAGETEVLCQMLNEWEINQQGDLPKHVWDYMKEQGFFGLVIPKEYGGRGFSARAHSDIIIKIASRGGAAAVTVMVPNSLGPGELLNYYGTEEQKSHYLPMLARGEEIPCFALTEPGAGSDATSLESEAFVVKKEINGEVVLGLEIPKLEKRWITLAPIATLIGLAVYLRDPQGFLGEEGTEGITCLLIPRDTAHLEIGNRHLPAYQAFMNGTIRGKNLFVPLSAIIGGQKNAGKGWHMLVECLSIGRSISLPALSAASSGLSYLSTGAFANVRRQFHLEIGKFEGVQEKLAEIAGLTYLIHATRLLTAAAVQQHKKPSVASAITKYFTTEFARVVINHSMDVHGGRLVVGGPRNYLLDKYVSIPISITVEGANIMSRNLLIFGQGSIACHPFIRQEFDAIRTDNKAAFKDLIWKHISYFLSNFARALCSSWTQGLFIRSPKRSLKWAYKRLSYLSQVFAFISDLSLMYLGGNLKRKERLSARLADTMSHLYMAFAVLCFVENNKEKQKKEDLIHANWALSYAFYQSEKALLDFCSNFPSKAIGFLLRALVLPWGQRASYPSDRLSQDLAVEMMSNNAYRDYLKEIIFLSKDPKQALEKMEFAFQSLAKNQALYKKVSNLKRIPFSKLKESLAKKVKDGELSQEEMDIIMQTEQYCWDAIQVDEFSFDDVKKKSFSSVIDEVNKTLDQ